MAFKLSKADIQSKNELVQSAMAKRDALQAAVDAFNEHYEGLKEKVESAQNEYNSTLDDLRNFLSEKANEFQAEFDEKSEKWQESERGEAAREFIDLFEQVQLEDVELDFPESLEFDTGSALEEVSEMDTEAAR